MWPYGAVGLAILAIFGLSSSSAPAGASGPQMIFKDYAWITILPSTFDFVPGQGVVPGRLPRNVAATIPAPPGVTSPGRWVEFPGGYACWGGVHGNVFSPGTAQGTPSGQAVGNDVTAHVPPGAPGNPIYPAWPNIPQGLSVYQWFPGPAMSGTARGNPVQVYNVSGYWVASVPSTRTALSATSRDQASMTSGGQLQGVLPVMPHFQSAITIPPPPGETAHSGKWHGVNPSPGYYVWLTPTNTNNAVQAIQAYQDPAIAAFLAQSGAGGGTLPTAPTYSAQGSPAALTQPSYQPTSQAPSLPAGASQSPTGTNYPVAQYGGGSPYPSQYAGG